MNSSLVTSKRFLINESDMKILEENIGEKEYLIEFLLTDISKVNEFEALYQFSKLAQNGTAITYSLYQLLNSLLDGIVAAVIILVTIMLMLIALVSLRFILLSTIAEDYDIRGNETGEFSMLEKQVLVNHCGTILKIKILFLKVFLKFL